MSVLDNIIQVDFPKDKYYQKEYTKTQVCLHHTVSGNGVEGDLNSFLNRQDNVNVPILITRDGQIYQFYSTKYWAYHLGITTKDLYKVGIKIYHNINPFCIGVELDSWGGLLQSTNGNWYPALSVKGKFIPNTKCNSIDNDNIIFYDNGFRGFFAFEKYTKEQIQSVKELLILWNERYKIPLTYNQDMFELSKNALTGKLGIWTHASYRSDKSDCHPQPELIDMLKSLSI